MNSIFTDIINRNIIGHFIYEDENHIAILDKYPIDFGHSLLIPKKKSRKKIFLLSVVLTGISLDSPVLNFVEVRARPLKLPLQRAIWRKEAKVMFFKKINQLNSICPKNIKKTFPH